MPAARTVVVKCGGAAGIPTDRVCSDVAALHASGARVVLVHGGSATVAELAQRLGVPQRELVSPSGVTARHTDATMLEVVTMALAGKVQPGLLVELAGHGVPAIGLTGLDAGLLRATRKTSVRAVVDGRTVVVRDDHSGTLHSVHAGLVTTLLDAGLLPVICPPAVDDDGRPVNVNADRVAAHVAAALGAEAMVLLTAAPGVLADSADQHGLTEYAVPAEGRLPEHVRGGMAIKLIAAREALLAGVQTVLIGDARVAAPVRTALDGAATRVRLAGSPASVS
jgi:[amino group carrier protein]-L-2-aminoadipate/L-glutamate 6-kinase